MAETSGGVTTAARAWATTLEDVALRAGVSQTTASRVLNGSTRRVTPDLSARVRAAAEELHYQTNLHARGIARGRSDLIGLVVSADQTEGDRRLALSLAQHATIAGTMLTIAVAAEPMDAVRILRQFRGQHPCALFFLDRNALIGREAVDSELIALSRDGVRTTIFADDSHAASPALQEWIDVVPYDGTVVSAEDVALELRDQLRTPA